MEFYIPNTVDFSVELSSKLDGFEGLQKLLDEKESLEEELAKEFALQVELKAEAHLYSSKERYLDALTVEGGQVRLDTSDFVVNMVENGQEPFDMKRGFLNSPKVKVGKDGKKFLVVPIEKYRHGKYNWRDKSTGKFKTSTTSGRFEFRIVSENSPVDSWIHRGHSGFHFMENTLTEFDTDIDDLIDKKIEAELNKF